MCLSCFNTTNCGGPPLDHDRHEHPVEKANNKSCLEIYLKFVHALHRPMFALVIVFLHTAAEVLHTAQYSMNASRSVRSSSNTSIHQRPADNKFTRLTLCFHATGIVFSFATSGDNLVDERRMTNSIKRKYLL